VTDLEEKLIELLGSHEKGLTVHQFRRLIKDSVRSYQISQLLGDLHERGLVRLVSGCVWKLCSTADNLGERVEPGVQSAQSDVCWDDFRRLCRFYIECARAEGGTAITTYDDREGESFVQLPSAWDWGNWNQSSPCFIPLDCLPAKMKIAVTKGDGCVFNLAGPLYVDSVGAGDSHRVYPVFTHRVMVVLHPESAMLSILPDGWPEVNTAWAERYFSRPDDRRSFAEYCGLETDGGAGPTRGRSVLSMPDLVMALSSFVPSLHLGETLNPYRLICKPLKGVQRKGFYNRFILTAEQASPYTRRLQAELRLLSDKRAFSDEQLGRTALAALFSSGTLQGDTEKQLANKPAVPVEIDLLNYEQRHTCASASSALITVLTGPPGTGKSRVIANIMADSAFKRSSVLFASRNHQAIDAVVPPLNLLADSGSFVIRLANADYQSSLNPFLSALEEILTVPVANGQDAASRFSLSNTLGAVAALQIQIEAAKERFDALDQLTAQFDCFLTSPYFQRIKLLPDLPSANDIEDARRVLGRIPELPAGQWKRMFALGLRIVELWPVSRKLHKTISWLDREFNDGTLFAATNGVTFLSKIDAAKAEFDGWADAAEGVRLYRELTAAQDAWKKMRPLGELEQDLVDKRKGLVTLTKEFLSAMGKCCAGVSSAAERQDVDQLRAMARQHGSRSMSRAFGRMQPDRQKHLLDVLLKHLPLWATTALSVGRHLPLSPGVFELLIVDEASQCDIASMIPLLFRARRVLVVGDPKQLRFVSRLKPALETRLRCRFGVDHPDPFDRFAYRARSFYDIASASSFLSDGGPIMLKDHFRCDPQIAKYFNDQFYRSQLHVQKRRMAQKDLPEGLHGIRWTDSEADGAPAPGGGAHSAAQCDLILAEITRLSQSGFVGTVGVVSPFRSQVIRINDAIEKMGVQSAIPRCWDFRVETADGFQGGERDVILFSLVGGPSMSKGGLWFYEDDPNRFNVAVSRARKVLHIFAPKQWFADWSSENLQRRHLAALLKASEFANNVPTDELPDLVSWRLDQRVPPVMGSKSMIGPVWEPMFAQFLWDRGLPVIQQLPACGRYLDIGLIDSVTGAKLDVEVDGESTHRDLSGRRKADDVERDITLVAQGWHVKRFWVYELRDDINACAEQVEEVWKRLTRR
jgi:hypothetical protein